MTTKNANSSGFPLRAIALLLGVFLLGSVFGAGVLMFSVKRKMQKVAQMDRPAPRVKKNFARLHKHLERSLDLTSEESASVEAELNTTMRNIFKVRLRAFRGVKLETVDSVNRIASQLPKEKGDKLRSMADKRLGPWGVAFPDTKPEGEE